MFHQERHAKKIRSLLCSTVFPSITIVFISIHDGGVGANLKLDAALLPDLRLAFLLLGKGKKQGKDWQVPAFEYTISFGSGWLYTNIHNIRHENTRTFMNIIPQETGERIYVSVSALLRSNSIRCSTSLRSVFISNRYLASSFSTSFVVTK